MPLDFSTAETQRSGELIPDGTVLPVHATLRPGGAGDGSWLKRNKAGDCLMMDMEFVVLDGPYAKRKFWTLMTVDGQTEGQQKAVAISHSRLRAILESAKGVDPSDESAEAIKARQVAGYQDFDGIRFVAVVGVEKGKDGYKDKNTLKAVVTPDRQSWAKLEQAPPQHRAAHAPGSGSAAPVNRATGSKPSWASADDTIPF